MFIYFLQRKGFMSNDLDYLRNRLNAVQQLLGEGHFYEFFKDFLLPLFHEGLGSPVHEVGDRRILELIGDVPFINGGIFAVHPLEDDHEISVPDAVFRDIFELFDAYQWHLDDRPSGDPNEINPDVLGYIFEQFINQKEQGAYYTKEDVTHYMTASTLLPVFLERLEAATGINPWRSVAATPDRYVWESLSYGFDLPLPADVDGDRHVFPRPTWNVLATEDYGLPGESWWEVVHRRDAFDALLRRCKDGDVSSVDEAVTSNLDLESLAIDVIDRIDNPKDVVEAWRVLTSLKVIDPTCGSGAFLFAALKILQALYTAVLEAADVHAQTSSDADLQGILQAAADHPNQTYFVLKHATLANLYGVDLMREAVELARLRLFLKLVAAIDQRTDLEPLPDLDFNIKAGNILVGAYTPEEIESQTDLLTSSVVDEVVSEARKIALEIAAFREGQETDQYEETRLRRASLVTLLADVRQLVDRHYYEKQGHDGEYAGWRDSHQPFHWFVEYPDVVVEGGFDVVVGNPPYISRNDVVDYSFSGFLTEGTPDIYAPCCERASQLVRPGGRLSMILPISSQFSSDFASLRRVLRARFGSLWVSTFSRNPAALFSAGLGVRSSILVAGGHASDDSRGVYVTKTHRWYEDFRPALFETLEYALLPSSLEESLGSWPRATSGAMFRVIDRMLRSNPLRLEASVRRGGKYSLGLKSIALYWLSCYDDEPPSFTLSGDPIPHTAVKGIRFGEDRTRYAALAVLSSKIALYWWACNGDDFNVTKGVLTSLPLDLQALEASAVAQLSSIGRELSKRLPEHVQYTKYAGKWMGNYVLPELRDVTDKADALLASQLGYEDYLPEIEQFYWGFYKPTGERPGTLRELPSFDQ
jgi:hypothetical protein